MKFPLFLLSVLCATNTAAFGISGAYERMLYWYAYQLDQQGDGPRVIAKGCAEQFGVKTCNLKQFLTHIAEGPVQVARAQSLPDAINAHNMNPDTAAEIIERSRLTGLYQEYYVYEGVDNTPSLFKAVSRYASYWALILNPRYGQNVNSPPNKTHWQKNRWEEPGPLPPEADFDLAKTN